MSVIYLEALLTSKSHDRTKRENKQIINENKQNKQIINEMIGLSKIQIRNPYLLGKVRTYHNAT